MNKKQVFENIMRLITMVLLLGGSASLFRDPRDWLGCFILILAVKVGDKNVNK